jgi:hypothetical protein
MKNNQALLLLGGGGLLLWLFMRPTSKGRTMSCAPGFVWSDDWGTCVKGPRTPGSGIVTDMKPTQTSGKDLKTLKQLGEWAYSAYEKVKSAKSLSGKGSSKKLSTGKVKSPSSYMTGKHQTCKDGYEWNDDFKACWQK